jgi:hypothetical protein
MPLMVVAVLPTLAFRLSSCAWAPTVTAKTMEVAIVAARTVREFSPIIAAFLGGVFHTGE